MRERGICRHQETSKTLKEETISGWKINTKISWKRLTWESTIRLARNCFFFDRRQRSTEIKIAHTQPTSTTLISMRIFFFSFLTEKGKLCNQNRKSGEETREIVTWFANTTSPSRLWNFLPFSRFSFLLPPPEKRRRKNFSRNFCCVV